MKNSFKFFSIAAAVLLLTNSSYAQGEGATATATATATILAPISILNVTDMNFGNITVDAATDGTVVLSPGGVRSVTGGITLPATATPTTTAASFTVTGEVGYTYTVTLPSADLTITSGVNTMIVNAFTSNPTNTVGAGLLTAGTQTLNVGATLNVTGAQPSGVYVSLTPFDVTVNYN